MRPISIGNSEPSLRKPYSSRPAPIIRTEGVEKKTGEFENVVVAEILVNEAGIVTDARVLKSIPPLDEAALKAVKEWRYDPTMVDGKAVPVKMSVTVNFSRSR